ncbi:chaperone NapD [Inhella proteolytica]|uniref:Chaperone NapD n=1 Tax=Inhella proteolytica TaxID=2795029 RepID=A0A931NIV4_9BURK|nr:chaperone NapD [Inhella proteolytica]MBH9579258.1 chaperone NapD [Inhella proteolytica]
MSILGVVLRVPAQAVAEVQAQVLALPGVDVTHNPGDGRLVLVIEDVAERSAAATLGEIAQMPQVWSSTLVYEYSGPDAPAPEAHQSGQLDWRRNLSDLDGVRP